VVDSFMYGNRKTRGGGLCEAQAENGVKDMRVDDVSKPILLHLAMHYIQLTWVLASPTYNKGFIRNGSASWGYGGAELRTGRSRFWARSWAPWHTHRRVIGMKNMEWGSLCIHFP
jgi:hypothetical protein